MRRRGRQCSLLVLHNPQQIHHIGGDHHIAEKNGQPPGGEELHGRPQEERGRKDQTFQQRWARRLQMNLQQNVSNAGQREGKATEISMHFGRNERIPDHKNARTE